MPSVPHLVVDNRRETRKLFVDFDYTLFSCNSTELFISQARPFWFIALIDLLIRRAIPWKKLLGSGGARTGDYLCIIAIIAFTPWNWLMWKKAAPSLFREMKSVEVERLIESFDASEVVIVSFGLRFIIQALLSQSRWAGTHLIATPLLPTVRYFGIGKADLVRQAFPSTTFGDAAFISDSEDDRDLLSIVGGSYKISQQGPTFRASSRLYLPLRYTASVKYGLTYVIDQTLFVDYAIWMLATSAAFADFATRGLTILGLMMSMLCVYEIGYFENDMRASAHEDRPTLSGREAEFENYPLQPNAWYWALSFFILAALADRLSHRTPPLLTWTSLLVWVALLVGVRLLFLGYNKSSPVGRSFLYPGLQSLKYFAIASIVTLSEIGACLIASHIIAMTTNYVGYRVTGRRKFVDRERLRLVVFGFLLGMSILHGDHMVASSAVFTLALAWLLGRACKSNILSLFRWGNGLLLRMRRGAI